MYSSWIFRPNRVRLVVLMLVGSANAHGARAAMVSSFDEPRCLEIMRPEAVVPICHAPVEQGSSEFGLSYLWDTTGFPPRWHCGTWTATHGWVHIISDVLIWSAYTSIPLIIIYCLRKRKDVPFPRVGWLFALFILACGFEHLLEAIIFWWPAYRLAATMKVTTAVASWLTVLALLPIVPRVLALPKLEVANEDLRQEVEQRAKAEERFRLAIDAAPSGMVMVNEAGVILLANRLAEEIFGWPRTELVGLPISELIPQRFRANHPTYRADYLKNPTTRFMGMGRDLYGLHKDGTEFPVEIGLNPIETSEGLCVLAAVVDITRRRNAEAALKEKSELVQRQNRELALRNAELDEFTYVASHDLQEPLRKIIGFSTLLERDMGSELPEPAAKDLTFVRDAVQRMEVLIQDLLRLSRSGRAALNLQPVSLSRCADQALDDLSERIEETGAVITRDALPEVNGDVTLLTQLYQNLIGNALKYRSRDRVPAIHLSATREGSEWVFGVRDNGIGIKPQYFKQVFVPFKRLHSRGQYEGTGVGLTICRKAIERHGGRIWIESEPGQGAHFRFTLNPGGLREVNDMKEEESCPADAVAPLGSC